MNLLFFVIILVAFVFAAWRQIFTGPFETGFLPMQVLSRAMVDSAANAVTLSIGLTGIMALFLGLMKVAEAGGLLKMISRLIRPLMIRLFPDVPPEHPAMGAMILNISANALGLGNAATPFGIRAMQELDTLNRQKGTASNAMALFLTINTAGVTLLPTNVIALRAASGSNDPAGILATTLFASLAATLVAIAAAKILQRFSPSGPLSHLSESSIYLASDSKAIQQGEAREISSLEEGLLIEAAKNYPLWITVLALILLGGLIPLMVFYGESISPWVMPVTILGFLSFGLIRRVRIYESFVEGAADGFQVAVKIIPFLVAILVAVGMFQASGAMDILVSILGPWSSRIGLPAEALPMALMRPLSGSGSYGVLASILKNPAIGSDSYTGYLVSTLMGSSETTFYVMAVYFGAVQIRRTRHTLAAALIADIASLFFSIIACVYFIALP